MLCSWSATTWQGGYVEGQYKTILFLKDLHENRVARGEKCFFSSPPTWPPWHHVQAIEEEPPLQRSTVWCPRSIFSSLADEQEGILYAHASVRSAEVTISFPEAAILLVSDRDRCPFRWTKQRGLWGRDWPVRLGNVSETNWPRGTGKRRTGTRQSTPHYQL